MATLVERRRFLQALSAASAVPAAAAAAAQSSAGSGDAETSSTPVTTTLHDDAAVTTPRFFDERQLAALRRLSGLIMPSMGGLPGATDVGVAEFLDFYVGQSPDDRRDLYRRGLDTLHAMAMAATGKTFSEVDDSQADRLISGPMAAPWSVAPPADPLAAFLRQAKADILNATMNSQDYVQAAGRSRRRRSASLYWYTIE